MRPAIPDVPTALPVGMQQFLAAVKERAELLSGERGGVLAELDTAATLPEAVEAINTLIALLQGR